MLPNLVVLLCLLSYVSGGIMMEKLLPSSMLDEESRASLRDSDSAISTMNSVILEHVNDILEEISGNLASQEMSGKFGIEAKFRCFGEVKKTYRSCKENCRKLSYFQRLKCNTVDFASYLGACFTGRMSCSSNSLVEGSSDSLVEVGTCSANCNCGTANDEQQKIYGGEDVEYAGKYPWHVGIINTKLGKTAYCGGTIIGDKYVITAASCIHTQKLDEKDFNKISVRIGDHIQTSKDDDIMEVTETISVEKIYFHPENNEKTFENDIALLQLSQSITFKNEFGIRPICLPCTNDTEDYAGKSAITLGWGKTKKDHTEVPATLKQAEVTILDKGCDGKTDGNYEPDMHVCSKSTFIRGFPCIADNGGSLFINEGNKTHQRYVLVGITLSSTCKEDKPVIYTRIKPALDWIKNLNLTSTCLTEMYV